MTKPKCKFCKGKGFLQVKCHTVACVRCDAYKRIWEPVRRKADRRIAKQ